MLINIKIKVTSPFLGIIIQSGDSPRRFDRNADDELLHSVPHFDWAVTEALTALKLHSVHPSCCRIVEGYRKPRMTRYTRNYSKRGNPCTEAFEAIPTGCVLTWQGLITSIHPDVRDSTGVGKRPPTLEEFQTILEFIGKHLGMSPWGHRYDYGRFKVLAVEEASA